MSEGTAAIARHRVLVASDNALERLGLRSLLESKARWEVHEAEASVPPGQVSVDLIALVLENAGLIAGWLNAAPPAVRIVVLTARPGDTRTLLDGGAGGVLLLNNAADQLEDALSRLLSGSAYLDPALIQEVNGSAAAESISVEKTPVLRAKLHRPRPPSDYVDRSGLLTQITRYQELPLTLVCAPAGFGKSVLISRWLEVTDWAWAWVSLDEADSALRTFLMYLTEAIRSVAPDACQHTLNLARLTPLPSVARLITALSNDLELLEQPLLLVLDDYHRIESGSPVHELMDGLLASPPIVLHLVLLTRREPPLSLIGLRAKGQVFELRMRDLAFDSSVTTRLLQDFTSVALAASDLERAHERLEGWPAGVRLLGLALRQTADQTIMLDNLAHPESSARDYLVNEILGNLREEEREWLLKTSLLDRFCSSLCDAVCSRDDESEMTGERFLDAAVGGGFFTIPLDAENRWLRFHHTFQSLLLAKLEETTGSAVIDECHRRASHWLEADGQIAKAVEHALKAGDEPLAQQVVESRLWPSIEENRWELVDGWLDLLPPERILATPELLRARAWTAWCMNRIEEVADIVEALEQLPVEDRSEAVEDTVAKLRMGICVHRGQTSEAIERGGPLLAEIPADAAGLTGLCVMTYGTALSQAGRYREAVQFTEQAIAAADADNPFFHSVAVATLMHLHAYVGEHQKLREQATLENRRLPGFAGRSDYREGCSRLATLEFAAAAGVLDTGVQHLADLRGAAVVDLMSGRVLVRTLMNQPAQADRAFRNLADHIADRGDVWSRSLLASLSARRALIEGRSDQALEWAKHYDGAIADTERSTLVECPTITKARILIQAGGPQEVEAGLRHLREIRDDIGRCAVHALDIAVLEALGCHRIGRQQASAEALTRSLALARSGGTKLPFVEPGEIMLGVFEVEVPALDRVFLDEMARHIRYRIAESGDRSPGSHRESEALSDLTNRELDTLELLSERLRNKEIAAKLFVSSETVKSHLKNIYRKLDVTSRRAAVERFRSLRSEQ